MSSLCRLFVAVCALAAVACSSSAATTAKPTLEAGGVLLVAPPAGDALIDRNVQHAVTNLTALAGSAPIVVHLASTQLAAVSAAAQKQRAGLVLVLDAQTVAADQYAKDAWTTLGPSDFSLRTLDSGSWGNKLGSTGATFVLCGAQTRLARQYAMWTALRRLGARYYHPEQPWLPKNELSQLRERAKTPTLIEHGVAATGVQSPDFAERSWTFHSVHPLEHLESFSDGNFPITQAENVNDWIVQNYGVFMRGGQQGVASTEATQKRWAELEALRKVMGFPRGVGLSLHNQQQGSKPDIDPNSPTPPKDQIEAKVTAALAAVPDAYEFGMHFGPTEFTTTPDVETLQWIAWAADKVTELSKNLRIEINVHCTGSQPMPHYDDLGCPSGMNADGRSDYYDLAFHTDSRIHLQVHTVMFYPLEGPAYVYNQKTFAHKLCLMQKAAAAGRTVTYFPEGSWWLSFDNPIPVYLPLYIQARGRDIELLKPLLATGKLGGHRMFNSGQEWGYWQQDYAVGLWGWNANLTQDQVLGEIFDPLCKPSDWKTGCAARSEAIAVLGETMARQKFWFLDSSDWRGKPGGRYAYFAGEDPADEIAAVTGFEFRPVRPSFSLLAGWNADKLQAFREGDWKALSDMEAEYTGWLARLKAIAAQVPAEGKPWLDEVIDGIEINQLRARQNVQLYGAVLAFRQAQLDAKDAKAVAQPLLDGAAQTLKEARAVITRREAQYRYPAAQEYGGGLTPETAVQNGTTYPWRVHTKTHLMTYWLNRDTLARQVVAGQSETVQVLQGTPGIAAPGVLLNLTWPKLPDLVAVLAMGNGATIDAKALTFDYGTGEGIWGVGGNMTTSGGDIPILGAVARSNTLAMTPKAGFKLQQPSSSIAQGVLGTLFPSLRWAYVDGSPYSIVAFAPDPDGDGVVDLRDVIRTNATPDGKGGFVSDKVAFALPVPDPATGNTALLLHCTGVVLTGSLTLTGGQGSLSMAGELSVGDLVQALIDLAGFDAPGAIQTLSGVLAFDPQNPPATVPFSGALTLGPVP